MTDCVLLSSSPYDGKWSKSMVGYGPEDDHFVVELTYNYGIGSYRLGNDFRVSYLWDQSHCRPSTVTWYLVLSSLHLV